MEKILVLTAFEPEYQAAKKVLPPDADLFSTGMGMFKAREAGTKFIQKTYKGVLVTGFCGALSPKVNVGELIICSKVFSLMDKNGYELPSESVSFLKDQLTKRGVVSREGSLYTSPSVVASPESKSALFNMSHADVVDMESSELAKIAVSQGVPVLVSKIVIDDHQMNVSQRQDPVLLANIQMASTVLERALVPLIAAFRASL